MKLGLGLKLGTGLTLTPQLQQAIRILQLSSQELELEIQQQLENNPLLELPEDDAPTRIETDEAEVSLSDCLNQNTLHNDLPVDTQWDDIYTPATTTTSQAGSAEFNEIPLRQQLTLRDHLQQQLSLARFSGLDQVIARTLIDDVDERGFLQSSLDDLRESIQGQLDQIIQQHPDLSGEMREWTCLEADQMEGVLHALQNFEPTGVFARNLTECLTLQVNQAKISPELRQCTLQLLQHTDLLLSQERGRLLKAARLSSEQLDQAMEFLKTLHSSPGSEYGNGDEVYQTPDVVVGKKEQRWEVSLNIDHMPRLRINSTYASMIRRADDSSSNQFLRHHLVEAKNFIKSIEERNKTLLKVASCIVRHQQEFLNFGSEHMKPLVLREVADEVELHESTVSRVTSQKYLLTPRGLFELKYFFSSRVSTSTGGTCSSTAIRAKIKKLIREENPRKPLSDQALAKLLASEGIEVARRTVAKYRESLNIPASSERKHLI